MRRRPAGLRVRSAPRARMRAAVPQILARTLPLALAVVGALTGCGGAGGSDTGASGGARPGAGRPAVTFGTKVSPVSVLLGQLYAQALRSQGYGVELKQVVGSAPDAVGALHDGAIDAMPLPVDALDAALGTPPRDAPSAAAAYAHGRAAAARHGLVLLAPTPFRAATALAILPAFAQRHGVASIADLARLAHVRLGASPGFYARPSVGLPALQRTYGIASLTYFPLTTALQYRVLDAGKIDVAEVATTDGQLASGTYRVLDDPRHLFGFEQLAPVVAARALRTEGPAFARTLNAVSAQLTPRAMQQLNGAVVLQHDSPEQVARDFLHTHGLA
jgi:osmoprotectant transport system substrate-binding protein